MANRKKYLDYKLEGGKWYGFVERTTVGEIWERVKKPPRSYIEGNGGSRRYKVGAGHAGHVSLSDRNRSLFPKDMFEKKSRGGYKISRQYTDPYRGKKFGLKNPYSALNIKINGSQKSYTQSTFDRWSKSGQHFQSALTFAWLRKHLIEVIERIHVNSMNYTVILSLRAQKIFQDSFKYKRFYSANGGAWPSLRQSTIKKRQRKNTWPGAGGILREYGDMFSSIEVRRAGDNTFIGGVITNPKKYVRHEYTGRDGQKHTDKRGAFCYAGLHNNGGTIRGGHHLPKRQFMGHSTYLFEFALRQADRYFFFNVFG